MPESTVTNRNLIRISQNAISKELHFVHNVRDRIGHFERSLHNGVGIETWSAGRVALATGAAAYRWGDLAKAPVSPSMLRDPRRYGDGAKDLWTTLNCVQENIIRGGQRDRSRRRPDGSRIPRSRAIKGIDEDMKLNKALWEMAEVLRNSGAQ
jgi:hypothetical protein